MSITATTTPALSNPGIFFANSGISPTSASILSYETYVKFYEQVHIPDWISVKPDAITAAWRWESLDPLATKPFLVAYKYENISDFNAPEYATVPLTHPSLALPGDRPFIEFVDFTRGPHLETYRRGGSSDERYPLMISETINTGGKITPEELSKWYAEQYIYEVANATGWKRTSRFSTGTASWLALHEFDKVKGGSNETKQIPEGLLGTAEISEKTREIGSRAKKVEVVPWELVRVYGDEKAAWGNEGEDILI
ncbi:hypothetical protein QBC35DRAFT_509956 [Podospora australis]|uniref:Uncharacterized protein n=1 Tax=Podospora australis TaxID=1536484 RepID=A0AAN6WJA1_9PEZI|nr:hypothetical protein QBC35DRAFT_509956 [Podospora australis]